MERVRYCLLADRHFFRALKLSPQIFYSFDHTHHPTDFMIIVAAATAAAAAARAAS